MSGPIRSLSVALATALVALTACGSDDSAEPATTPPAADAAAGTTTEPAAAPATAASPESSVTDAAAFPVTIEHKYGSTTIDAEPVRVVALGVTDQDPLLALGVTPVAVVDWRGSAVHPWNAELLAGAGAVGLEDPAAGIDFETIAASEPDLIVSLWSGITESDYATLSEIAPTVAQSADYPDYGAPWDVNTRTIGLATGRTDEAEVLIDEVEALIDETSDAHPELADRSITIAADFADGSLYITEPDDARYDVLAALGMDTAPESLRGIDTLSFEQVDQLNALDAVFWITLADATIATDPVYTAQPIHTEGRDIFPTTESQLGLALTFSTVLSIPYLLEHLVPLLAAAVDGDPATS